MVLKPGPAKVPVKAVSGPRSPSGSTGGATASTSIAAAMPANEGRAAGGAEAIESTWPNLDPVGIEMEGVDLLGSLMKISSVMVWHCWWIDRNCLIQSLNRMQNESGSESEFVYAHKLILRKTVQRAVKAASTTNRATTDF
jgi:hypothetical protein